MSRVMYRDIRHGLPAPCRVSKVTQTGATSLPGGGNTPRRVGDCCCATLHGHPGKFVTSRQSRPAIQRLHELTRRSPQPCTAKRIRNMTWITPHYSATMPNIPCYSTLTGGESSSSCEQSTCFDCTSSHAKSQKPLREDGGTNIQGAFRSQQVFQ